MHFNIFVLAGMSSLAAFITLPSAAAHDSRVLSRHRRLLRPRGVDPIPSEASQFTANSSSSSSASLKFKSIYIAARSTSTKQTSAKPTSAKPTSIKPISTKPVNSSSPTKSTATSTNNNPAPTSGTGGISISDKLLANFPLGFMAGNSKWSTNPDFNNAIALSDEALRATKGIARLSHPVVDIQGKKAMKISYSNGSYAYLTEALGGVSFYALGPASQPITNAKALTFSYSLLFSDGFKFNKGGKLPGLYGGTSADEATGCSGGRTRDGCWSTRMMWRTSGAGELYAYLPPSAKVDNKAAVCSKTNISCDEDYGWSLGRSTWTWKTGTWQTIAQKVTLNDVGKPNGSVVIYVDGKEVYAANNIMLRMSEQSAPQGVMVQSFFGGHTIDWASPQDQTLHLADFSLAVLETE